MQSKLTILLLALFLTAFTVAPARAQLHQAIMTEVALKSGESVDLGDLWWTVNCKTFLKGLPEVEILEGPSGVVAAIKEKMVLPRIAQCANRVRGANLTLTASDITDDSTSVVRLRIKYPTLEGRRDRNWSIRVVLIAS
jgi:hypothetical protein